MNPLTLAVISLYLLLAFACWMAYQLLRQNGRMLMRIEALETRLGAAIAEAPPGGLPRGTPAPPFELPTLDNGVTNLERFRGRKTLLVFFDPRCGFCQQMAPKIVEMQREQTVDGQPALLLVTTGDAERNRHVFAEHRIDAVVALQQHTEVMARYQARGTPTGYLIDEQGMIASDLAIGSSALLALARGEASGNIAPGEDERTDQAPRTDRGNRPLSASRITRDGLAAGTAAPPFRLPRVGGGEGDLAGYRGRKLLLVFSDPYCGPCQRLAPELEQRHRRRRDVDVLMVSRGGESENRKKIAEQGLTFPVGLQRHWEVSRAYGMFATPIAFLVDEEGVIARNVAVGPDAILAVFDTAQQAN